MTNRLLPLLLLSSMLIAPGAWAKDASLTIVLPERPDNLEPCFTVNSNIGRVLSQNVVESLTRLNIAAGKVEPRLARDWTRVDDLTWRFKLNSGVTFQDGAPFNAAAVVRSIARQMGGAISCANNAKLGGLTIVATAVDEDTVDIVTSQPSPILPSLMPLFLIVSPNTPADQAVNAPVGTGPYVLNGFSEEEISLERFDKYWGKAPEVKSARYVWRSESAVRAAMVAGGEADLTPDIAVQDAGNAELDKPYLNSETTRIRISADVPPLDDVRVRKALNMAIDWDGMKTLFGSDVIRAAQLVVSGIGGHNDAIQPWTYDPDQARSLLAAAANDGVPVETVLKLIGRNGIYPNGSEAMEAMMAMWQEVGFKVELTMLDVSAWVDYDQKPYPANAGPFLLQQQHDNATGDGYSTAYFLYGSEGQTSGLSDPKIDGLLAATRNATGEQRDTNLQEIFATLHEPVVADVPMFHMVGYARVAPHVAWLPTVATNSEIMISSIGLK